MSNEPRRHTRQAFVGTVGTGIAAAALTGNVAAQTALQGDAVLPNPTDRFEKTFPMQQQPWPGLQAKMNPRPDCGETSYQGTGRLRGRKMLVTGADSGIGRAAAIAFAKEGADVAINYLPQEEPDAREVVEVIKGSGRKAVPIPGDLREEQFCRQLVDHAVQQLGGLDAVVNVAGRQQAVENIEELSTESIDSTFKTNVYAMVWIVKAALPHLRPGSVIINTASEQGYNPDPWLVDYAMTKAAIVNFTKSTGKQLAKRGIRVNAVAPGPFWTALQISGGTMPSKIPTFGQQTPLGRAGQPVEIAPVYVALAAGDLSYGTGGIWGNTGGNPGPG